MLKYGWIILSVNKYSVCNMLYTAPQTSTLEKPAIRGVYISIFTKQVTSIQHRGHPFPHRGWQPTQDSLHGCLFPKSHFFSLLAGLPILGSQTLGTLEVRSEIGPILGGLGETKGRGGPSRLVGGRFNNKGNLPSRSVLGSCKKSRYLYPPTQISKVYLEALGGIRCIYPPDAHCSLRGVSLKMAPTVGTVGRAYALRTMKGMRRL